MYLTGTASDFVLPFANIMLGHPARAKVGGAMAKRGTGGQEASERAGGRVKITVLIMS